MNVPKPRSAITWYWLLPAAFIVHDIEEIFTMPGWIAGHRDQLAALANRVGLGETVLDYLPSTIMGGACAVSVMLAVFIVITAGAWFASGRGFWQYAYAVVLGSFFLHGFTHLGQAAYFGAYTPGVVTAAIVVIPASLYLYHRLLRARLLTLTTAIAGAAIGIVLLVPAIALALMAGCLLIHH